jgi:hypothetical protein
MIHHQLIRLLAEEHAEELRRAATPRLERPESKPKPVRVTSRTRRRFARLIAVGGGGR